MSEPDGTVLELRKKSARQMQQQKDVGSPKEKSAENRRSGNDWTMLDASCHKPQDSLLSSSSGYTNYRGFFNLSLILLFLSNARVALENIIKYGVLVDPISIVSVFVLEPHKSPLTYLFLAINFYILPCLYVEKSMAKGTMSQKAGTRFYFAILTMVLTVPALVIFLMKPNPFGASLCLSLYSVAFLKLISYASVNYYCRRLFLSIDESGQHFEQAKFSRRGSKKVYAVGLVKYPDNLTVKDLYFFLLAPTLCYELNFPRNDRIHWWFVFKRLFEFLFIFQVILALNQQWIAPLLKNSLQPFIGMDYGRILERLLKLAIPNHIIWLLAFYWMFHSFLNLVAELLRFADRQFYMDWWNAESIQYFWQNWNIPVHKWCARHVYLPLVGRGCDRLFAGCVVFLISALLHEYLISIPLHLFRLWAFTGMLAQIPLNWLTGRLLKGWAGNVTVWLSLILGQPLCILMYVHDWYVEHQMGKENAQQFHTINTTTMSY